MSDQSPVLSLPFILPSQAQKHVTHNEALTRLDALVQAVALTDDRTEPPVEPEAGESHIVAAAATGLWAGQDHIIAYFDGTAWLFLAPKPGWKVFVLDTLQSVVWDGSNWIGESSSLQNLDGIGIQTTSDTVNRFSVSSEASLLNHDGAGHQLKINKATTVDTASLLFQTGFSGRAEMGTAGEDAFAIKVSPDGANFQTAMRFDPSTGLASGQAVQSHSADTTPGRLMRADFGYGPGNLLGPVSENAGVPTGAVIERGRTANGAFTRFADGTLICQFGATLSYVSAGLCSALWTFPASFAASTTPQVIGTLDSDTLSVTAPSVTVAGLSGTSVSGLTSAETTLNIHAIAGASFANGESVTLNVTAMGHWF